MTVPLRSVSRPRSGCRSYVYFIRAAAEAAYAGASMACNCRARLARPIASTRNAAMMIVRRPRWEAIRGAGLALDAGRPGR